MLHSAKIRVHGEGIFPATPHPNQKFVREIIKWAKKKDTWGDMIRRNFRRRPQKPPAHWVSHGFAGAILTSWGRWVRGWAVFRQKVSPEPTPEPKKVLWGASWGDGWRCSWMMGC